MRKLDAVSGPQGLMGQAWLAKIAISSVASLFLWLVLFSEATRLPFSTQCVSDSCEVTAVQANAATADLRRGDRLLLREQSFATRAVLIDGNVPRDRSYDILVRRGAQRLLITLHTVSRPLVNHAAQRSVIAFAFLFGLLMLWRGETTASRGLCLFALSIVLTSGLYARPFPPPWNVLAVGLGALLGGPGAFLGLYITVDALVRSNLESRAARRMRSAYVVLLLLLYLTEALPTVLLISGQHVPLWNPIQLLIIGLAVVVWIVPLIFLLQGYRASTPENRLRIRWFIASIVLLLPLIACNLLLSSQRGLSAAETVVLTAAQVLLPIAIFSILSYAALSQRLVAVRFVLNRALVFGVLTASLIGALSLLESLIERSVISKEAGMALDLLVPLLLGISIQRIHRWGEESVERVVFRSEYRARHEITTFVRDAGFISHPSTLFERTVEVFAAHAGGRYAALYLVEKQGYERVATSAPTPERPAHIPVDDVAMVRLRATLTPLDLFSVSSPLGATGLALPLVIRGQLEGVLVCGAKAEGRYAQAEIEFLGKAATGIAACIVALRAELHGRFVTRVAEGVLSSERMVEEARTLVEL